MLQFEIYFCHNILEWKLENKMKPIESKNPKINHHQMYELVLYFSKEWDEFVESQLKWLVD
jgi:hypothetical protein